MLNAERLAAIAADQPILKQVQAEEEVFLRNRRHRPAEEALACVPFGKEEIREAEERLKRFRPYLAERFPETTARGGIIESDLVEIPHMKDRLQKDFHASFDGRLFLKRDSDLAIAGSVKARGGIYEILKHTEELALEHGILTGLDDDYRKLAGDEARAFFSQYTVQAGSTGNLGISIGTISAAVGYRAVIHMSVDAKQWKKDLLRSRGVTVIEYDGNYEEAVRNGRDRSASDPMSYFVDDETSQDLFFGYAAAASAFAGQLQAADVTVNADHPLFVYLPCGVGGAPGGICFGLKQIFGDHVFCLIAEPTGAPAMLLGIETGLCGAVSAQDFGLTGKTAADGLAVGRPSDFVSRLLIPLADGEYTVHDAILYDYLQALYKSESIFIEPSACAALHGPAAIRRELFPEIDGAVHVAWATGGALVPEEIRNEVLSFGR